MGYTVISPSNPRKSPKWRCSWEYHHLNMVFNLTIWPDEMTLIGLRPLVYESSNARPSAADFWHSWRQISQHKASRMVQDGTRWYQPKMLNRNWNQRLQWMLVGDHFIITGCGFPNGVHCIAPSFPGLILCDHNDVTTRGWNGFALESLYFLYVCMSMCILYIYIYHKTVYHLLCPSIFNRKLSDYQNSACSLKKPEETINYHFMASFLSILHWLLGMCPGWKLRLVSCHTSNHSQV